LVLLVFLFSRVQETLKRVDAFRRLEERQSVDIARGESGESDSAFRHQLRVLAHRACRRRHEGDRLAAFGHRHRLTSFRQREECARVA
jgi:hypothetical protein